MKKYHGLSAGEISSEFYAVESVKVHVEIVLHKHDSLDAVMGLVIDAIDSLDIEGVEVITDGYS